MTKNVKITALEAECLRDMISDGYFWDNVGTDWDNGFITWGVCGRKYAGCQTSLDKKGVISVDGDFDGDTATFVGEGWTKKEICELCGWFDEHPEYKRYFA